MKSLILSVLLVLTSLNTMAMSGSSMDSLSLIDELVAEQRAKAKAMKLAIQKGDFIYDTTSNSKILVVSTGEEKSVGTVKVARLVRTAGWAQRIETYAPAASETDRSVLVIKGANTSIDSKKDIVVKEVNGKAWAFFNGNSVEAYPVVMQANFDSRQKVARLKREAEMNNLVASK